MTTTYTNMARSLVKEKVINPEHEKPFRQLFKFLGGKQTDYDRDNFDYFARFRDTHIIEFDKQDKRWYLPIEDEKNMEIELALAAAVFDGYLEKRRV